MNKTKQKKLAFPHSVLPPLSLSPGPCHINLLPLTAGSRHLTSELAC